MAAVMSDRNWVGSRRQSGRSRRTAGPSKPVIHSRGESIALQRRQRTVSFDSVDEPDLASGGSRVAATLGRKVALCLLVRARYLGFRG
jgi:hypothetical protein